MSTTPPRQIVIFDTTLRDGEQSPGCSMNLEEKLEVAQALVDLGVDVIEAGFPIASPGDFEAVREVARTVRGATICGLARCSSRCPKSGTAITRFSSSTRGPNPSLTSAPARRVVGEEPGCSPLRAGTASRPPGPSGSTFRLRRAFSSAGSWSRTTRKLRA